jgi:hypothetical protein
MNKRPLSVTIIGCVYILTGVGGLAGHFSDFKVQNPFQFDIIGVALVRLIAVVCGVYMLRGQNWARWLALAWIAFHVILSAFHSLRELAMHILICAILAYFLLRSAAARYFGPGLEA